MVDRFHDVVGTSQQTRCDDVVWRNSVLPFVSVNRGRDLFREPLLRHKVYVDHPVLPPFPFQAYVIMEEEACRRFSSLLTRLPLTH